MFQSHLFGISSFPFPFAHEDLGGLGVSFRSLNHLSYWISSLMLMPSLIVACLGSSVVCDWSFHTLVQFGSLRRVDFATGRFGRRYEEYFCGERSPVITGFLPRPHRPHCTLLKINYQLQIQSHSSLQA